ncbi:hypothetical protein LWI29_014362 [Acer saccharum]|uniref:RNase H type-1 domain-containing protein n=1 Tax=Acer saccharum TaxID=4024 RepID=A0AA39RYK5_ACESA|nr:hypothetical protein LWI29_014362 [Acer saccharum]
MAILKSFHFASNCGLFQFLNESDAKRVVNWITNFSQLNSRCSAILQDIERLHLCWKDPTIIWSPVSGNKVALGLAKEALKMV